MKVAKSNFKNILDKTELAVKSSKTSLDLLLETANSVSKKEYNEQKSAKFPVKKDEIASSLRVIANDLEKAEKSGKEAERLLIQAREQGEKEANIYLKYFQYSKAATASTTNNKK